MPKITPFLMFNNGTQKAFTFYTSVFKNSRIISTNKSSEDSPYSSGEIEIEGQRLMAFDGGDHFSFSDGISLFVSCDTQEEVDYYWEKLSEGGEESQCGWLKDKFGLSWQIIPKALGQMLGDADPEKSQRALQAMLQMKKIDINQLKQAFDQK